MEAPMVKEKEDDTQLKELLAEYDERFQILATEIQDIKDIVLKLQSYTMDVNKTLLEERIQIMNMNNTPQSANETIEMIERIQNDTPPERELAVVENEEEMEMDDPLYNISNLNDIRTITIKIV
jgi:Ser/Thr protein kinase RdoA (MazF antagonist)